MKKQTIYTGIGAMIIIALIVFIFLNNPNKASSLKILHPFGASYRPTISQDFGNKSTKYLKGWHDGIDFAAGRGTPVYTGGAGEVLLVKDTGSRGYGRQVWFYIPDLDITLLYAHLDYYNVKTGQQLAAWQQVGVVGNTGFSFGDHLHFGVYKGKTTFDNVLTVLRPTV